jgi:hypothetical protein
MKSAYLQAVLFALAPVIGLANWRTLRAALKLAPDLCALESDTDHIGPAKHLITYNRIRTALRRAGEQNEAITGAIVHIAVALAYLRGRKN